MREALHGLALSLVLLSVPVDAGAQELFTARDALDSLETMRTRAEPLWREGDPQGLEILRQASRFLEQPGIADLVRGSVSLQTRRPNLEFEIACAQATLGDSAEALRAMRRIYETGGPHIFAQAIERACPPLHALRERQEYQQVRALWRSERLRWTDASLATPYRERLSVDERVAGLSQVWSQVKFGLPGFEVAPGLDLDSLYLAYLPQVREAGSTFDYYRVLERFVADLGDAHTNIYFPDELRGQRYARPPLRTLPVGDRVLVRWVLSPTVEEMGVVPGLELLAIDGVPVREYAETRVRPFVSASTPQDREIRTYSYELLAGDSARPVVLSLRRADGSEFEVDVPRAGYEHVSSFRQTRDTVLEGEIGYLRIDGFAADTLTAYLETAMRRMTGTRGLVVDLRYNGGGSSRYGYRLLSMLTGDSAVASRSRSRGYIPVYVAWGIQPMPLSLGASMIRPHPEIQYGGPVAVLIGPMTFSAAEDFVVAFDAMGRGVLIGEPTAGSTGQPLGFSLPGGGSGRVRVKHDTYPDGRQFIGVGIEPDLRVHPTVAGLRAGKDEVLEAALDYLEER